MKRSQFLIGIGVVATVAFFAYLFSITTKPKADTDSSTTVSSASNTANPNTSTAQDSSASPSSNPTSKISAGQLAQNNGKNGSDCWVALNGKVYNVSNSPQWKNGRHTPSDGQAFCGADMSKVIGESPHGTAVLKDLPVIGVF